MHLGPHRYPQEVAPDPTRDDPGALLEKATFFARGTRWPTCFTLGANPNNKANGGSAALEACIRHLGWENIDSVLHRHGKNYQTPSYTVLRTRDAIRLLVEHGALWKPEAPSLNDARRILYKIEPQVTVELAGLLVKHQACDHSVLHDFLRPPRMQQHLTGCEHQMARIGLTEAARLRVLEFTRSCRIRSIAATSTGWGSFTKGSTSLSYLETSTIACRPCSQLPTIPATRNGGMR